MLEGTFKHTFLSYLIPLVFFQRVWWAGFAGEPWRFGGLSEDCSYSFLPSSSFFIFKPSLLPSLKCVGETGGYFCLAWCDGSIMLTGLVPSVFSFFMDVYIYINFITLVELFLNLDPLVLLFCLYFLPISVDFKSNPGPIYTRRWNCCILYGNICGLYSNINDLAVSPNHCDILLSFEILVSWMKHILVLLITGYKKPIFEMMPFPEPLAQTPYSILHYSPPSSWALSEKNNNFQKSGLLNLAHCSWSFSPHHGWTPEDIRAACLVQPPWPTIIENTHWVKLLAHHV